MTIKRPKNRSDRSVHLERRNAHLAILKCTFAHSPNVHFTKYSVKTSTYQVAGSLNPRHCHFSHKNKGFGLVCSLLRVVWINLEAHGAERPLTCQLSEGKCQCPPANGTGRQAQTGAGVLQSLALCTLLGLSVALFPAGAIASDWSSSGSFDVGEAKTMRVSLGETPARHPDGWAVTHGTLGKWVALDAFERSLPGKARPREAAFRLPAGSEIEQLYALIAFAEAPALGYDAIHHSAKTRPSKKPTQMTLGEIHAWIDATPGQHHAIGRFQIIPSTLARLQSRLGMDGSVPFNRPTQNRMASLLIADAGYHEFRAGHLSLSGFMDDLAKVWAGLPTADGRSHYHGYAGNRATISRAFYAKQMALIFERRAEDAATAREITATRAAQSPAQAHWQELGR